MYSSVNLIKLIRRYLNKTRKGDKLYIFICFQGESFSLADHNMGFGDSIYGHNDPVLKEAAKILRLIHLVGYFLTNLVRFVVNAA